MQIDWFTFVAQIFNFVLLVYLLKRFLYRPILDAVQRREAGIRDGLEEARRKEEEADAERSRLQDLQQDLEDRRDDVLRAAEEEAERRRQELTSEVRDEVRTIRDEWRESLRRQRESFLDELRIRVTRELYGLVERVLVDLADAGVEDRLLVVFTDRLAEAGDDERDEFVAAKEDADGHVRLRSSFPLTAEQRRRLETAIQGWAGTDVELSWEEDPKLGLGIELQAGDRKIAWSVDDYLEVLQTETSRFLEAETR